MSIIIFTIIIIIIKVSIHSSSARSLAHLTSVYKYSDHASILKGRLVRRVKLGVVVVVCVD